MVDDSGTGNTDVDNIVGLCHAVECASHERVIVRGIAEYHQLGTTKGVLICSALCCLLDDLSHELDGIHVDTGLCGAQVDGGTDAVSAGESFGNGSDQKLFGRSHALCGKGRKSADEIDPDFPCGLVQGLGNLNVVSRALACGGTDEGNRGYGDTLVHDGDRILALNLVPYGNKVLCSLRDALVDVPAKDIHIIADAVQKRYSQSDCPHIQVLLLYHLVGFNDFVDVYHAFLRSSACS